MSAKKLLGKFLLKVIYRCSVTGSENLPKEGGVIVAANHISMRDVIIVGAALDRQIFYMAKKELFRFKPFGAFISMLGAFPVDRGSGTEAVKRSLRILGDNKVVGIFPQGTRRMKVDPSATRIQSGVGMLQARSGCPVLPISIKTKNFKIIPFFRKTQLIIGKPMTSEDFSDISEGSDRYYTISKRIFDRIIAQMR